VSYKPKRDFVSLGVIQIAFVVWSKYHKRWNFKTPHLLSSSWLTKKSTENDIMSLTGFDLHVE